MRREAERGGSRKVLCFADSAHSCGSGFALRCARGRVVEELGATGPLYPPHGRVDAGRDVGGGHVFGMHERAHERRAQAGEAEVQARPRGLSGVALPSVGAVEVVADLKHRGPLHRLHRQARIPDKASIGQTLDGPQPEPVLFIASPVARDPGFPLLRCVHRRVKPGRVGVGEHRADGRHIARLEQAQPKPFGGQEVGAHTAWTGVAWRPQGVLRQSRRAHDGGEGLGLQARAADEAAVHVGLGEELGRRCARSSSRRRAAGWHGQHRRRDGRRGGSAQNACIACACSGLAVSPVPMAQTGS